jgi:hypothetical protein
MRTSAPEELLKIVDEIDEHGQASLTRLTVLKKWFARPKRLSTFALWVAVRAVQPTHTRVYCILTLGHSELGQVIGSVHARFIE